MESIMFTILAFSCIGYIVAETDLADKVKDIIFFSETTNFFYSLFKYIFYCSLCFAFWSCLIYTGSIFSAVISAILSEIISKYISYER